MKQSHKLTRDQARAILRAATQSDMTRAEIKQHFRISDKTITDITTGKIHGKHTEDLRQKEQP